jgi:hypothetical protein
LQPGRRSPSYAAIELAMLAYARGDQLARRGMEATRRGLGALLAEALTEAELRALSVRLYGALLRPASAHEGLWDWESRWLPVALPPAPARVLVGGAGAGREAAALVARGYQVDALEPAAEVLAPLQAAVGEGTAVTATYEDLSRAVLDGAGGPAAALVGRHYHAILLGWGSLTHVLAARERERALLACDRLTDGPILASFWMIDEAAQAAQVARATRLGRTLGKGLARLRLGGASPLGEPSAFGHAFTRDEVEALAARLGRPLRWDGGAGSYPHATFLPRG